MNQRCIVLGGVSVLGALWAGCSPPSDATKRQLAQEGFCGDGVTQLKAAINEKLREVYPGEVAKDPQAVCTVLDGNPDWTCFECKPGVTLPPDKEQVSGSASVTVNVTYSGVTVEVTLETSYSVGLEVVTTTSDLQPRADARGTQRALSYVARSIAVAGSTNHRFKGSAKLAQPVGGQGSVDVDTTCAVEVSANFYSRGSITASTCGSSSGSGSGSTPESTSVSSAPAMGTGTGIGVGYGFASSSTS
ncbi:MAG: hypothetical protein JST00_34020 [Deltaproteobacteria bacterium]|nr:hypothetical protein [Deltaproteobacteria bacterium]